MCITTYSVIAFLQVMRGIILAHFKTFDLIFFEKHCNCSGSLIAFRCKVNLFFDPRCINHFQSHNRFCSTITENLLAKTKHSVQDIWLKYELQVFHEMLFQIIRMCKTFSVKFVFASQTRNILKHCIL